MSSWKKRKSPNLYPQASLRGLPLHPRPSRRTSPVHLSQLEASPLLQSPAAPMPPIQPPRWLMLWEAEPLLLPHLEKSRRLQRSTSLRRLDDPSLPTMNFPHPYQRGLAPSRTIVMIPSLRFPGETPNTATPSHNTIAVSPVFLSAIISRAIRICLLVASIYTISTK